MTVGSRFRASVRVRRHGTAAADSREDSTELHTLLLDTARRLARSGPLVVLIDCPQPLHARIAPTALERVLTNLVSNAQAAGATTVRLTARPADSGDDPHGRSARRAGRAAAGGAGRRGRRPRVPRGVPAGRRSSGSAAPTPPAPAAAAPVWGWRWSGALVSDAGGTVTADNRSGLGGAAVHVRLPAGQRAPATPAQRWERDRARDPAQRWVRWERHSTQPASASSAASTASACRPIGSVQLPRSSV